jgi:hypothetical protein
MLMNKQKHLPVIVTDNGHGGCIDIDIIDEYESTIIVKQGERYAQLIGDIPLLISTDLHPGDILKPIRGIKHGKMVFREWKIIVKESLDPFEPDHPEWHLKKKDGKVCTKDGKPIYSHSYVTYEEDEFDELIDGD